MNPTLTGIWIQNPVDAANPAGKFRSMQTMVTSEVMKFPRPLSYTRGSMSEAGIFNGWQEFLDKCLKSKEGRDILSTYSYSCVAKEDISTVIEGGLLE